jgi:cytoskeletal protein CcmA (bactofilin family)
MWKARPDDKPNGQQPANGGSQILNNSSAPMSRPAPAPVPTRMSEQSEIAHIGKSVVIKGELSGSEDLYLDGAVEGSIELTGHSITIGPNGRVKANIHAREVVILGKVDGNVNGDERVEVKRSGVLAGDISTQRILIEDGAYFKGSIDVHKDPAKAGEPTRREMAMAAAAGSSVPHNPLSEARKI